MRSTRTPAQWCASFLLLVAAGTHVPLIEDHLEEAPYVGWLFIALCVTCLGRAARDPGRGVGGADGAARVVAPTPGGSA